MNSSSDQVQVFDETEGNWYSYLNGSKAIFHHLSTVSKKKPNCQFLYTWLIYHEVLGAFSQPLQLLKHNLSSMDLFTDDSFDSSIVSNSGFSGCSLFC